MIEEFEEVERLANDILAGKITEPEDIPEELMGNLSYYLNREYNDEVYEGAFGEEAAQKALEFRKRLRRYARDNGIELKSSMLNVDRHANELYETVSELIGHANDYDDLSDYHAIYQDLIEKINSVKSSRAEAALEEFEKYIMCDDKYTFETKGSESAKFIDFVRKGLKARMKNKVYKPDSKAKDLKYAIGAAWSNSSVGRQAGFITKQVGLVVLGGALVVGALSGPVTWASVFGLVTAGICGVGVYKGFTDAPVSLKPDIKFPKFTPKPLFSRLKDFVNNFAFEIGESLVDRAEKKEEQRAIKRQSREDNKGKKTNIRQLGRVSDYDEQLIYQSCAEEVLEFADRNFTNGNELAVAVQMINNRLASQLTRLPKCKLRTDYYSLAAKFQKMCETKSKNLGKSRNGKKEVKNFKSYLTRDKGRFYIADRDGKARYAGWKVNTMIDDKYRKNGVSGRDQFYDRLIDTAERSTRRR